MDRKDKALELFDNGFNCSQSVFSVFCEELGLDMETGLKIATGFGGGMRKAEVCGAVTGAIMTIGLKEGRFESENTESKDKAYALTKKFIENFERKNDSIICKKLLGYDISEESQKKIVIEKGLFTSLCPNYIVDAVDILEDMFSLK